MNLRIQTIFSFFFFFVSFCTAQVHPTVHLPSSFQVKPSTDGLDKLDFFVITVNKDSISYRNGYESTTSTLVGDFSDLGKPLTEYLKAPNKLDGRSRKVLLELDSMLSFATFDRLNDYLQAQEVSLYYFRFASAVYGLNASAFVFPQSEKEVLPYKAKLYGNIERYDTYRIPPPRAMRMEGLLKFKKEAFNNDPYDTYYFIEPNGFGLRVDNKPMTFEALEEVYLNRIKTTYFEIMPTESNTLAQIFNMFALLNSFEYKELDKVALDGYQKPFEALDEPTKRIVRRSKRSKSASAKVSLIDLPTRMYLMDNSTSEAPPTIIDQPDIVKPKQVVDDNNGIILDFVEKSAMFPGGEKAMLDYFDANLTYPAAAKENNISGRVVLRFVVEPDGSRSNIEVVRKIDESCDQEAVRLVKNMPLWTPAMQNGHLVRQRYMLPIFFKLKVE